MISFSIKAILLLNLIMISHQDFLGYWSRYLCEKKQLDYNLKPFNMLAEFAYDHPLNEIGKFNKTELFPSDISTVWGNKSFIHQNFYNFKSLPDNIQKQIFESDIQISPRFILDDGFIKQVSETLIALKYNILPKSSNTIKQFFDQKNKEDQSQLNLQDLYKLPITILQFLTFSSDEKTFVANYKIVVPYLANDKEECRRSYKMPEYYKNMKTYQETEPRRISNLTKKMDLMEKEYRKTCGIGYVIKKEYECIETCKNICKKGFTCISLNSFKNQCVDLSCKFGFKKKNGLSSNSCIKNTTILFNKVIVLSDDYKSSIFLLNNYLEDYLSIDFKLIDCIKCFAIDKNYFEIKKENNLFYLNSIKPIQKNQQFTIEVKIKTEKDVLLYQFQFFVIDHK